VKTEILNLLGQGYMFQQLGLHCHKGVCLLKCDFTMKLHFSDILVLWISLVIIKSYHNLAVKNHYLQHKKPLDV
jgi:hypothetical protein